MKGFEPLCGNPRDTPTCDADTRGMSSPLQPRLLPRARPLRQRGCGAGGARIPPRAAPGAPHFPELPLRVCPVPPRRGPDPSPPFTQRQSSHLTSLEAVSASGEQGQAPSCCPSHAGRPRSPPSVGSLSVQHPGPDPATPVSGAAAVSEASRAWPWGGAGCRVPGGSTVAGGGG